MKIGSYAYKSYRLMASVAIGIFFYDWMRLGTTLAQK